MELFQIIQPGMFLETNLVVESQHTAAHVGSGSLRVLATPIMIGLMESNSHRLLAQYLPEGSSSVGALVEVRHLAPTPLGGRVWVRSEVLEVDGLRVVFAVKAWDEQETVGEGRHTRVVIDTARFIRRVEKKAELLASKPE
jgi:predicted thioesterase